jgi:hypothetical protein
MKNLRRSFVIVAALVVAALVAVGVAVAAVDETDTDDRAGPPVTQPTPTFDWASPTPVDLGGGWSVADAEGDGPFVEVRLDGAVVGFLEYMHYPYDGTLDEHVADFYEAIGGDRADAPIEGYRFVPDRALHAAAADGPIVRYGFTGTMPDGGASERTYQWAGIRNGAVVLVSAAANDPGGLFPPEGTEFTTAQLESVVDRLDRLVRASGLPDPA